MTNIKTIEFINKAKEIHGDKYDYSKVVYIKAIEKVIIICKIHGEFKMTPNKHLSRGDGCKICGIKQSSEKQRSNNNDFIKKAQIIHTDDIGNPLYDYSNINYLTSKSKISIICKVHGIFQQSPNNHLTGYGCIKCRDDKSGNSQRLTKDDFIRKAQLVHIDEETREPLYEYDKVIYKNNSTDILIHCKIHGYFTQRPANHLNGAICFKCSIDISSESQRMTTEEFVIKAKEIHGKYDYSQSKYGNNNNDKINIKCYIHGLFNQTPTGHLSGHGCPNCGIDKISERLRMTTDEFIIKAKEIHGEKYDYSQCVYIGNNINVKIHCIQHNITFYQMPSNHYRSSGCKKCSPHGYSKSQIQWLNLISKLENIYIQHAENSNEYTIPNTNFKADGYCEETNTIYEYHGDYWHGNPKKYNPNKINIVSNKTFGELYQNTLNKEKQIKEMGFNLITIWESDWIKLNKYIRILQQKFRKSIH